MSRAVEVERARLEAAVQTDDSPQNRHALALVEARETALLVQVHTPQRGTPFRFEQVGTEGAKQIRERIQVGFVTASKVIIPAHDGLVCVLPEHAPMVALLGSGEIVITSRRSSIAHDRMPGREIEVPDAKELRLFVSGGTFSVRDNRVLVLPERGFDPAALNLDDLEDEDTRRAIQARIAEGLEGAALNEALRDAKRAEVRALRERVEARKPSLDKEAAMQRLRAIQKTLGV